MDVQISRDGYIHHDRYEQGKPVIELEKRIIADDRKDKKDRNEGEFPSG